MRCPPRRGPAEGRRSISIAAFAATLLSAVVASADSPANLPPDQDRPRFRGGIGLDLGALVAPATSSLSAGAIPFLGLAAQLGVQINDQWAVYVVPGWDDFLVFRAGLLAEWTYDSVFSVAVGPEVGYMLNPFAILGGASGVPLYGGDVHLAGYPVVRRGADGVRRHALSLGVDVHLLAAPGHFFIAPVAGIAYTAF
jgi:hypothetical protein